ncbi:MAG: hypothetical protein WCJ64_12285 [Rhodospirillaceae bacterium]
MADLSTGLGVGPQMTGYAAPTPAPAGPQPASPQPAHEVSTSATAATTAVRQAQAQAPAATGAAPAKSEHPEVTAGFNPSVTIDPDTHILVMTIRAPDGDTLRQMPNQHELAAYKASASQRKKGTA